MMIWAIRLKIIFHFPYTYDCQYVLWLCIINDGCQLYNIVTNWNQCAFKANSYHLYNYQLHYIINSYHMLSSIVIIKIHWLYHTRSHHLIHQLPLIISTW